MILSELIKILKEIQKTEDDLMIFRENNCSHYGEDTLKVKEIVISKYGELIFK